MIETLPSEIVTLLKQSSRSTEKELGLGDNSEEQSVGPTMRVRRWGKWKRQTNQRGQETCVVDDAVVPQDMKCGGFEDVLEPVQETVNGNGAHEKVILRPMEESDRMRSHPQLMEAHIALLAADCSDDDVASECEQFYIGDESSDEPSSEPDDEYSASETLAMEITFEVLTEGGGSMETREVIDRSIEAESISADEASKAIIYWVAHENFMEFTEEGQVKVNEENRAVAMKAVRMVLQREARKMQDDRCSGARGRWWILMDVVMEQCIEEFDISPMMAWAAIKDWEREGREFDFTIEYDELSSDYFLQFGGKI